VEPLDGLWARVARRGSGEDCVRKDPAARRGEQEAIRGGIPVELLEAHPGEARRVVPGEIVAEVEHVVEAGRQDPRPQAPPRPPPRARLALPARPCGADAGRRIPAEEDLVLDGVHAGVRAPQEPGSGPSSRSFMGRSMAPRPADRKGRARRVSRFLSYPAPW